MCRPSSRTSWPWRSLAAPRRNCASTWPRKFRAGLNWSKNQARGPIEERPRRPIHALHPVIAGPAQPGRHLGPSRRMARRQEHRLHRAFHPRRTVDTIGRTLAQKLGESRHQTVVVENKPGQAGGIGAAYVARAAADGYTLLGGTISTHAINASIYKTLPYDPMKDFEPVTLVGRLPNVLVVNSQLGVGS